MAVRWRWWAPAGACTAARPCPAGPHSAPAPPVGNVHRHAGQVGGPQDVLAIVLPQGLPRQLRQRGVRVGRAAGHAASQRSARLARPPNPLSQLPLGRAQTVLRQGGTCCCSALLRAGHASSAHLLNQVAGQLEVSIDVPIPIARLKLQRHVPVALGRKEVAAACGRVGPGRGRGQGGARHCRSARRQRSMRGGGSGGAQGPGRAVACSAAQRGSAPGALNIACSGSVCPPGPLIRLTALAMGRQ